MIDSSTMKNLVIEKASTGNRNSQTRPLSPIIHIKYVIANEKEANR